MSAKSEFHAAVMPLTGKMMARGSATARVTEAIVFGAVLPIVTMALGPHAHLGPNWIGTLIILQMILAAWFGLRPTRFTRFGRNRRHNPPPSL